MIPTALSAEAFDPRVDPLLLYSLSNALATDGRDDDSDDLAGFASDLATIRGLPVTK